MLMMQIEVHSEEQLALSDIRHREAMLDHNYSGKFPMSFLTFYGVYAITRAYTLANKTVSQLCS